MVEVNPNLLGNTTFRELDMGEPLGDDVQTRIRLKLLSSFHYGRPVRSLSRSQWDREIVSHLRGCRATRIERQQPISLSDLLDLQLYEWAVAIERDPSRDPNGRGETTTLFQKAYGHTVSEHVERMSKKYVVAESVEILGYDEDIDGVLVEEPEGSPACEVIPQSGESGEPKAVKAGGFSQKGVRGFQKRGK